MSCDQIELLNPEVFQLPVFIQRVIVLQKLEKDPDIIGIGDPGARAGRCLGRSEIFFCKRREIRKDLPELKNIVSVCLTSFSLCLIFHCIT